MRWDVLPPLAAVRRPLRARRRATPCRSSTRRSPCSTRPCGAATRASGEPALRLPRRRALGADLGGPAASCAATAACPATPRWRARRSSSSGTPARRATACRRRRARRWRSSTPGASEVKVFAIEGEGGPHPGRQPRDQELGLGPRPRQPRLPRRLERLRHRRQRGLVGRARHARATGSRRTAGASLGTEQGMEWGPVTRARARGRARRQPGERARRMVWVKTRKGRGYGKYDNKSHGTPHADAQPGVLDGAQGVHGEVRRRVPGRRPAGARRTRPSATAQARANLEIALSVLDARRRRSSTTCRTGWSRSASRCPSEIAGFKLGGKAARSSRTRGSTTSRSYPAAHVRRSRATSSPTAPRSPRGARGSTRCAQKDYGRPLVHRVLGRPRRVDQHRRLREGLRGREGLRLVRARRRTRDGALLPQQITEFTNSGLTVGPRLGQPRRTTR